jgi:hypothetical protein
MLDELDEDRYIDAHCFLYIDNNYIREVYLTTDRDLMTSYLDDTKGPAIKSPLLFVRGATCVKSISFC